jgi:hypothetical protein
MRKIILTSLLFHWLTAVIAQQQYSKAVNEQIARVENTLSGGLASEPSDSSLVSIKKL